MSPERAIMYGVAVLLLGGGVLLLGRSGLEHLGEPARYAHRIAGAMAIAGGACLAIFATIFFSAVAG